MTIFFALALFVLSAVPAAAETGGATATVTWVGNLVAFRPKTEMTKGYEAPIGTKEILVGDSQRLITYFGYTTPKTKLLIRNLKISLDSLASIGKLQNIPILLYGSGRLVPIGEHNFRVIVFEEIEIFLERPEKIIGTEISDEADKYEIFQSGDVDVFPRIRDYTSVEVWISVPQIDNHGNVIDRVKIPCGQTNKNTKITVNGEKCTGVDLAEFFHQKMDKSVIVCNGRNLDTGWGKEAIIDEIKIATLAKRGPF